MATLCNDVRVVRKFSFSSVLLNSRGEQKTDIKTKPMKTRKTDPNETETDWFDQVHRTEPIWY